MATLTGKKINTTYDGLLKTEDNQPISTTKKKVTDGYGNETGLSVDSLGNVDVSDDLNVLGNAVVTGSTTANSFIKTGGTSSQFLKADGSLDSNTYITSEADTLDSVTDRGNATPNAISVGNLTAVNTTVESIEINYSLKDQVNSTGSANDILTSTGTATSWQSKSDLSLIDGSGTANKLPKFTDSDTIGNSIVTDNGTGVGINNSNPTEILEVYKAADNSRFKIQNNTFASWVGNDATGFAIETNLFKPITFKPAGVTAMTLDSSGNVTLNNNLSVSGSFSDSNSSTGTSGQVLSSTGTGTDWVNLNEIGGVDGSGTTNYLSKWTDADTIGNSVIYDDGSRIGIGTNSPSPYKLNVNGDIFTENITVGDTSKSATYAYVISSTTGQSQLRMGDTDSDAGAIVYNNNSDFMLFRAGAAERMRLHSTGDISFRDTSANEAFYWDASTARLGLGTTSPSAALSVTHATTQARFEGSAQGNVVIRKAGTGGMSLFSNAAGTLAIYDNDAIAERMRIDSSGNVGIGTSSPAAKLNIEDTSAFNMLRFSNSNGGTDVDMGANSSGDYLIRAGGSERIRIDSSGNVKVGTIGTQTSSTFSSRRNGANIEFGHGNITSGYYGTIGSFSNSGLPYISFSCDADESGNTVTTRGFKGNLIQGDTAGSLIFSQATNANSSGQALEERMRIDSSGNVGIGTTSQGAKLHIRSASDEIARFESNSSTQNLYISLYQNGQRRSFIQHLDTNDTLSLVSEYGDFRVSTGTGGNEAERLRITSSGNVGIGTSSPAHNLTIEDTTDAILHLKGSDLGRLYFGDAASNNVGRIQYYHIDNSMQFYTNSAERMRLEADGDLHVDGDVIAYSTTISDQRLKDDIQTIDNALDKVSNLRGVSYTWNNGNRKGQKDLGLIAQEVEQVLPELVREKEMPMIDGETYKTVDYEKIVGVLIEAVKELKTEIEILKSK